ncbi:unnamed protein product [Trifolium pratense]|uniref:Uncharacterized protein n=1 Tax=Trifolium pratense TaxID=57577 RepID=A0ACB0KYZ9_TRIPR|nr:unnamed protein product [Trifolium pratense]
MPPRRAANNQQNLEPTVDMAGTIQAIHTLAAAVAQQSATTAAQAATTAQQAAVRAQREAVRDQREEAAAVARELRDFSQYNPPKFNGEHDPDKADRWLEDIEKIFEMLHCTDAKKVEYGTFLLRAEAESWWRGERQIMENNHEELNWESFKEKFLGKYFPSSARSEKEKQFLKLFQGNMTISEYADKFESLAKHFRYFRDHVDEDYKCERFEIGLRYEIRESVEPLEIRQFQALVEKCKKVERMKRERMNRGSSGGPSRLQGHQDQNRGRQQHPYNRPQGNGRDQSRAQNRGGQRQQNTSQVRCYHCDQVGHVRTECPERARVCYRCQEPGHFARDCQAPKRKDLVPSTNNNNDAARPTAKGRVYHIGGEEISDASGLIQGECEISDKLFPVLYDSGATHSFISVECVNSLQLLVTSLPFDLVVDDKSSHSLFHAYFSNIRYILVARELVESMAQNEYRATNDRGAKKKGGVLELDTQTALLAQQKLMTSQMEAMMKLLSNPQVQSSPIGKIDNVRCDFCLQDHPNGGCFPEGSEEARYLANFRKPYNNNNNGSGWGNGMQSQGAQQQQQRPPSRMEETLNQFMLMTQSNFEAMKSRGFGGNTHDNPKNETCNGITLRSREIPERPAVEKPLKKKVIEGEVENEQEVVVENERYEGEVEKETMTKEVEISEDEKEEVEKQRERKEKESKKMLTRLTGKGKKKSDANPPQEPPKKPRTKMSASKGQSSRSAQASPPRRSNVTRPQVHPHFISEVHEKRYSQIRTFTINQEKGFGEDLLKGVAELGNEIRSRGWERFNKLMIKDEMNPGNQMWAREFFANAYLPDQPMFPEYVSVVRGVKVSYSFETINNLLGCAAGGVCELLRDRERIDKSGIEVREELKNIVCRPGAMWLAHSAASLPRRLSLTSFNPVHRAWGEFWLKNVRVVGNNSEIQLDNAHAVRLLVEGKFINLGYWLQKDLHEIANHPNPTFTLGHCNLIAALCRANNVPMNVQEGDLHPVRPLSLSYFIKKFERGPIVPRGEGNAAREEALREEEEINRFEEGNHPDQQGDPANEYHDIPAQDPPRYSHDMNQLASMLHQMEISQYSGLPNLYFDTASSMYTEAMTYRSTFPPPTFGTLYPIDTDWEAHQARELNSFQARQAYNSGLRTSELAEIERRRRVEQDEAAAMEREMLDVDGLNLNLNSPFTNYFTGQPDDAV